MECKHAYRRDDVDYIICDVDGKVTSNKLSEVAPKLCLYQRFCPNIRNCALLPTWVDCQKLANEAVKMTAEAEIDEYGEVIPTKAPTVQIKRTSKKKSSN